MITEVRNKWSKDETAMFDDIPRDGSTIGNKALREVLGWTTGGSSDTNEESEGWKRFWRVRDQLIGRGVIAVGRGKGGSVRRVLEITAEPEEAKSLAALEQRETPEELQERNLYPGVKVFVETELLKTYKFSELVVDTVADKGKKKGGGKWSCPDIVAVGLKSFELIPGREIDVITIEVKPEMEAAIDGIFETMAHTVGSTYSYLAVFHSPEKGPVEEHKNYQRVCDECARLGLGFFSFSEYDNNDSYTVHLDPRRTTTEKQQLDEFLTGANLAPGCIKKLHQWVKFG